MATWQERLDIVQTAIMEIETGAQSYMVANRQLTRANLPELYRQEKWLLVKVNREANGGGIRVRGVQERDY